MVKDTDILFGETIEELLKMKNTMLDKTPINANGQLHGPYQDYRIDGRPWETSHYVNDVAYGYTEVTHWIEGEPSDKFYFCR